MIKYKIVESTNRVYACQVEEQHYLARKDGGAFDKHEYRNNPELYKTEFVEKVANRVIWVLKPRRIDWLLFFSHC